MLQVYADFQGLSSAVLWEDSDVKRFPLDLPFEQVPQALIESMFRLGRQKKEQMALLHITMPSSGEVPERRKLNTQVAQAIETFLRNGIAQGRLAPCNTEMYAQLLYLLGHAVLHQCFAVEGGEREELYRQTMLEFVERLLFGSPLHEGESQVNHLPERSAP